MGCASTAAIVVVSEALLCEDAARPMDHLLDDADDALPDQRALDLALAAAPAPCG